MARVRVIGCGNPDAGDDAAGLEAAEGIRERAPADVEVMMAADPLAVLELIEDEVELVVLVDAVRTMGGPRGPGTIVRAELGPDGSLGELRTSLSSHGFGIAETVGLVAAIRTLPRVVFFGVEAGSLAMGADLSPEVQEAIPELVDAVLEEVRG
jgi:hydrogenase maturation protease